MQIKDKYHGQDDARSHLTKWIKVYGEDPQPELAHLFYHTLDIIPMNWYIERELHNGKNQ